MSRLLCVVFVLGLSASAASANELCQGEFQPLIKNHQAVMARANGSIPKGKPQTFEQAEARARAACSAMGSVAASFEKLNAWVSSNKDFCQIPDKVADDIRKGLAGTRRNQASACGAIAQLRAGKAKALAQQQRAAQQGPVASGGTNLLPGGERRNDPFSATVTRKPQLQGL